MSRYVVVAVVVLMLSGALVQSITQSGIMQTQATQAKPPHGPKVNAAPPRTVVIPARDGHFAAGASVNGRPLSFLVDTGATLIALRESDANAIGIRPFPDEFRIPISTANGKGVAASAELDRVQIGTIEVRDVAALILPDDVLSVNLLGMSFLSRVRWTHQIGQLVLEESRE